jgi:hypothetical protein
MAETEGSGTVDARVHTLAAFADAMEGRVPEADRAWVPATPGWVRWLIPAAVGPPMASYLRRKLPEDPPARLEAERRPIGVALWQHIATERQWCPEINGNGNAAALDELSRVTGFRDSSDRERVRKAVLFTVAATTSAVLRGVLFSTLRTVALGALAVFIAVWQADSLLSALPILVTMSLVALLGNAAISARLLARGRARGPRARLVYAVVVLVAGGWALGDLIRNAESDLAWWRVVLEGALVVAAAALLARLLFAGVFLIIERRRLRDHVDDRYLYSCLRILHLTSKHAHEWTSPDVAREVNRALEDGARAVEQGLASRFRSDRAGSHEWRAHGRAVAAAARSRKSELAKTGGRERLADYARSSMRKVLQAAWFELETAPAAPALPLWRRGFRVVMTVLPLAVCVVLQVSGAQLHPLLWATASGVLIANLWWAVDPDYFTRSVENTKSVMSLVPGRALGDGRGDQPPEGAG